jgi:hypothetical protein
MTIAPLLTGLTPESPAPTMAAASGGNSGAFQAALQAVMIGVERATPGTVDQLWALQQRLQGPVAGWYQGQTVQNLSAAVQARDGLLVDFTRAMESVLRDYGISASPEIRFAIDESGRVRVAADHPDSAKITALIQESPLLNNAIATILADSQQIAMAYMAQRGQATPEMAADLKRGLSLSLSMVGKRLAGEVLFNGSVLASTERSPSMAALQAMLDEAIHQFDQQEQKRRIDYEHTMAQLKLDDERRRTETKQAKEVDLADKLSEQEAAERKARLHPEQEKPPIFI